MFKKILSGQRAAVWYVLLVFCLPVITLVLLGLVHLWQNQWLIPVSALWLAITATGYLLYRFWPASLAKLTGASPVGGAVNAASDVDATQHPREHISDVDLSPLPVRLEEREDWTAVDRQVWKQGLQSIEQTLESKPDWQALPELCLELLPAISQFYATQADGPSLGGVQLTRKAHAQKTYSFTLPELLLVVSITSNRYRQLILSHVPFAERIKVSSLMTLYSRQDQIKRNAGWVNNVRRAARFMNPVAAVVAELRDHVTDKIFTNLSESVQHDLKRLLLQELVQVSMDLYSGRLKNSAEELALYRSLSHTQDADNRAAPVEPLRVVVIGQISSGKSSLINALIDNMEAETDVLPTTDKTTVHTLRLSLDGSGTFEAADNEQHSIEHAVPQTIHLIDTVGFRDTQESILAGVTLAKEADLVIWLTRATQPARAPDAKLWQALQAAFSDEPARRAPPVLLVVTHIDQLSPKAQWAPPYDLNSDNPKSKNIGLALESCKAMIGMSEQTPVVPVSLSPEKDLYNIDLVSTQIMQLHTQATQAQLNRRRTEHNSHVESWGERWEQAARLGKVTGKTLARAMVD